MAELNKLTDRILEEAKEESRKIIDEAKAKVEKIEERSNNQSNLKYNSMVEKGALEAQALKERMRSSANLRARDQELKAKQKVIGKVYEATLKDLIDIDDEGYVNYVSKNASFSEGSQLVIQEGRKNIIKSKFPNANIVEDRFCESGFIEIAGGIEKNFTFSTQLDYIKDEVQGEIAKVLFK